MIFGISGMISSGKSTLTKKLARHFDNAQELVEFEEDDEVFNTFLKWLYENKENLTIGFQTYIIESHASKLDAILKQYSELDKSNYHIFLDRFSIEHFIFAKINLSNKDPKYIKAYTLAFKELIDVEHLPDLAIFLDISFETFKERFHKRGREVEINNWEQNKSYFQILYNEYKNTFIELCNLYHLNYVIVDTNNLTEDEVFVQVTKIIKNYLKK